MQTQKAYLFDFLHFYYGNFNNISELKQKLIDDDYKFAKINNIIASLGEEVLITTRFIGNCYENLIIANKFNVMFDSVDKFEI